MWPTSQKTLNTFSMLANNKKSGAFGIMVIIILTAIVSGTLSYASKQSYADEKMELEKKVEDLKQQLNATQNTLLAAGIVQMDENKTPGAEMSDPTSGITPIPGQNEQTQAQAQNQEQLTQVKTVSPMIPATDVKFASCGILSNYSSKNWYPKLQTAAAGLKIALDQTSESCFSENGGILTINTLNNADKACGTSGTIYNYSLSNDAFLKAIVISKSTNKCLAWPKVFGKREGTTIKMEGSFGEGCRTTMYYDYDFIKNIMTLKKELIKCDGQSDKTITY